MCDIEDRYIRRQRATPESYDHQRRTRLDYTTETKLLDERADEGSCNGCGKWHYDWLIDLFILSIYPSIHLILYISPF